MSGITIGNGAVIGARAIVTKDVPAYHQCFGAPMKINFHPEIDSLHALMEELQWWDWDDEKIRENAHLLLGGFAGKMALANKYLGKNFKLD